MSECLIKCGDCLSVLPSLLADSVQCCVTSPPYWRLRDYGVEGQLGLEPTLEEYIQKMVAVFREVWRVLRPDGTLWLNLGDVYAAGGRGGGGSLMEERRKNAWQKQSQLKGWYPPPKGLKRKDLCGIPWRVAFALQADGWYLRSDIIWHKPNSMPEPVTDRPTKSHEYFFLLSRNEDYFYDARAIRKPPQTLEQRKLDLLGGGHKRSVWTVPTQPYFEAHFATFPEDLIKPAILAGSRFGDWVLDPFGGSGTTGKVALELGRAAILIELNPGYVALAKERVAVTPAML